MRASLDLLPPCATTGIGSLPLSLDEALQLSMQQDVPYLPELPAEPMLAGITEGPTLDAFLQAARVRAPRFIKAQLAGPATLAAFGPQRVTQQLAQKAAALTTRLMETGAVPVLFLDEPALHQAAVPVEALESVRRAAQEAGAIVGLHCCGQARWGEVLELGFDLISLDARLSLDALLEHRRAWLAFVERGGALCLGIIPTGLKARYQVDELCDSVEVSLRSTTPGFKRVLLSPACGLALHSAHDAWRINAEVRQAQARLRSLL